MPAAPYPAAASSWTYNTSVGVGSSSSYGAGCGKQIAPEDASAWCYKLHVASSQVRCCHSRRHVWSNVPCCDRRPRILLNPLTAPGEMQRWCSTLQMSAMHVACDRPHTTMTLYNCPGNCVAAGTHDTTWCTICCRARGTRSWTGVTSRRCCSTSCRYNCTS
jgi:hypothetical protein